MLEQIKRLLMEFKEDEHLFDNLPNDFDIIDDVNLDSLQMINFLLKVEEVFEIEIDYEELDLQYLHSVVSFIDYIRSCKVSNV